MLLKIKILLAIGFSFALSSCYEIPKRQTVAIGDEIDSIMAGLTLEEKVGQMTNLTLATIATEEGRMIKLDTAKITDVIVNHNIGSIQNVMNHAYTFDEWTSMVNLLQKVTLEKTRHKIPFLYCIDAVHGANYIYGATLFPHNIGLGATRNPELVEKCAAITAAETRASGVRYNFSPVLDVGRNQQWSRLGETFGEDVYLVTQLGGAAIKGLEGEDVSRNNKVASCMKHFVGYSVPQNGKDRAPAYIPEIVLREYFLPTFRNAVNLGAKTLMVNSGEINGTPVHANKYLLTDVLRTELGFKGVVISDWQDIIKLQERHRVAKTHKAAVFLAVDAGIDMCIVPFDFGFYNDLIELVKEGKISESRINESVRRILQLKKDLGLFQNPYVEQEAAENFAKPEYTATSLQAALESVTLLKNEDSILPLSQEKKVFITGPNANSITALHGAWSYCWQGNRDSVYPSGLQSISQIFEASGAKSTPSFDYNGNTSHSTERLVKSASQSDIIIICLGEPAYAETPGNSPDLEMDHRQVELVKSLSETGKPIVLVLLEGRPRIIREIEPLCKAIIQAYWPGPQGAQAIHDVISGKFNPAGKLPYTYPRYAGTLITYDHKLLDEALEIVDPVYEYKYEFKPQYEFGHGLSYTSFSYDDIVINKDTISTDSLLVSVQVTNTGNVDGHEVIELYTQDLVASVTPSVKRLRRFQKVFLKSGESKAVNFILTENDLAFVNEKFETIAEEGDFELIVSGKKKPFYLKKR